MKVIRIRFIMLLNRYMNRMSRMSTTPLFTAGSCSTSFIDVIALQSFSFYL